MGNHILTDDQLCLFRQHLKLEEREQSTVEKYLRDLQFFAAWLAGRPVTAEVVADWKNYLRTESYKPETINSKLSALNKFFAFMQWPECRVKYLKIQRKLFRGTEKELTKEEYLRLLETANDEGKTRLALLIETICATGIRVSEVKYITVEAVQTGYVDVALKGKIRTILLPGKLCR
ncbi:MAG: site-specific integrase, partial [Oscillibacter sp.]|nr:site-specific integrase [Oscillibacter sp.]